MHWPARSGFETLNGRRDSIRVVLQIRGHRFVDLHPMLKVGLHIIWLILCAFGLSDLRNAEKTEQLTASSAPSCSHSWILVASFCTLTQILAIAVMFLENRSRSTCPSFSSCVRAALIFSMSYCRSLIFCSLSLFSLLRTTQEISGRINTRMGEQAPI